MEDSTWRLRLWDEQFDHGGKSHLGNGKFAEKEDKLNPDIFEYEILSTQETAPETQEIVPLASEFLVLVAGGDIGSGLIKIPK